MPTIIGSEVRVPIFGLGAGIGSGKGEIDIAVDTFDDAFYLPALIGQPLFHRSAFGIDDNDAVSASRINLTP